MFQFRRLLFLAIILIFSAAGCSPEEATLPASTPDPLQPYSTSTRDGFERTPSVTPQLDFPTPTPLTYTVVAGDTLNGIASRYGVTLSDLLAANPEVAASTLSIGTVLIIPTTPISTPVTGPTPVPLPFTRVDCWPSSDGGLWCFAGLTNTTGDTLENLVGQMSFLDESGTVVESQTTMSMLDILPPGKSTALAIFFPAPSPQGIPQAKLISAVRILPIDERYAAMNLENVLVNINWTGLTAQVSGSVTPQPGKTVSEIPAGRLWVAATAYDETGRVVGVRRWESDALLPSGGSLPFSFEISSMGPAIDRVDLLVEARP